MSKTNDDKIAYAKAIAYRKNLEKAKIEAGSLIDLHNPPYNDQSWEGPIEVIKIIKGGRVQLKGHSGQFSPSRLRLPSSS